jgi:hypothetical protein
MSEPYYFWLGASADADRAGAPSELSPPAVSSEAAHPSRLGECIPYEPPSLADDC